MCLVFSVAYLGCAASDGDDDKRHVLDDVTVDTSSEDGESGVDGSTDASRICDPGATQACVCASGENGAQSCAEDGSRWEGCVCEGGKPSTGGDDTEGGAGDTGQPDDGPADADSDGWFAGDDADCDDNNPDVHPGKAEVSANGVDDDCDGEIDEEWTPPQNSFVYVHTADVLFRVDPGKDKTVLEKVGAFSGLGASDRGVFDIALDEDGEMIGITDKALYDIDPKTAKCLLRLEFPPDSPQFNSLSYVKGVDPLAPEDDRLVGASSKNGGEWVAIDPEGTTVEEIFETLGRHDPARKFVSSGDIVSVQAGPNDYRTFATLKCDYAYKGSDCESDWLAEIDAETGKAQRIGQTGFSKLFGLGFWGDEVYGFSSSGDYVVLNIKTGAGTSVDYDSGEDSPQFWGAGTVTKPYIVL